MNIVNFITSKVQFDLNVVFGGEVISLRFAITLVSIFFSELTCCGNLKTSSVPCVFLTSLS